MTHPTETDRKLRQIAADLKNEGMRCNCDLDNWVPERTTGHSCVCRIHKTAMEMKNQFSAEIGRAMK